MNRLVIIGNGFDLAHGLKTSYMDFINWYWEGVISSFVNNHTTTFEDVNCAIYIKKESVYTSWYSFVHQNQLFVNGKLRISAIELIKKIENDKANFTFKPEAFFSDIMKSIESKGWVDIEYIYYKHLKENLPLCLHSKLERLNRQLAYLLCRLIDYLGKLDNAKVKIGYLTLMTEEIKIDDVSIDGQKVVRNALQSIDSFISNIVYSREKLKPESVMLLSFNYTPTAYLYTAGNIIHNYIHGELSHPESIIFGYGDELDRDYKNIQELNDNELLKNVKSVKYLEASRYREMLRFINSGPFQVFIMGHSCGNSDRTLLNTIFEHENCISIKPFYYEREDGRTNYLELVQNMSRCFTDMKLFRDRVVNKEQCEPM